MNAINIDFAQFVQIQHSQPVTTSEFIAKAFGKAHKDVLRKIDQIAREIKASFYKRNFAPLEKRVKSNLGNGTYLTRSYELTKDGFMLLVMGFTGKDAMAIKIAYIEAFNAMAEKIKQSEVKAVSIDHRVSSTQKRAIREAVAARCGRTGESWQKVYYNLHVYLGVNDIAAIPASMFQTALRYLDSMENAPQRCGRSQSDVVLLTDHEISRFATVVYYLDSAARQLKELCGPLREMGAVERAGAAWTMWSESQRWLGHCRQTLKRVQPNMSDMVFREHVAGSLSRMAQLENG